MTKRQSPTVVHYEVYVLDRKRWTLHARMESEDREAALDEAKRLDRDPSISGVKVVRETYHSNTNQTEETTIFIGARTHGLKEVAADAESGGRRAGGRGGGGGRGGANSGLDQYSNVQFPLSEGFTPTTAWGMAARIVLITMASLAFGALVAAAVALIMGELGRYGVSVASGSRNHVLFASFLLGFLICALPMMYLFVIGQSDSLIISDNEMALEEVEDLDEDGNPIPKKEPWWRIRLKKKKDDEEGEGKADSAELPEMPDEADLPDDVEEPKEEAAAEETPAPEPEEEKKDEEKPEAAEPSASFETDRLQVMRFLSSALGALKPTREQLAASRFALDLMLAGACEVVAGRSGLRKDELKEILFEAVQMIGTRTELALPFSQRYEAYLVEPRYEQLVQLGREVMTRHLDNAPDPFMALRNVLDTAGKTAIKTTAEQSLMTVIFTDMVGSTDLTQAVGDFGAQEVVRRHNAIVRTALAAHGGKEIKHTGDGIMASFPTAISSVNATIEIQRAIRSFNATKPEHELHVRIGINSGEPIQEEDDLFGSTVQMAARICAKAGTDQIYCSSAVRELCKTRPGLFTSLGAVDLKGFKEPVVVYEVSWTGETAQVDEIGEAASTPAAPAEGEGAPAPVAPPAGAAGPAAEPAPAAGAPKPAVPPPGATAATPRPAQPSAVAGPAAAKPAPPPAPKAAPVVMQAKPATQAPKPPPRA
ncbi:MAG: adenylate/guanylate cyclase domain-containing protein [Rhodospirillales bacterium]|nr:adenylate/guanylate cyclase domain-containing protein [Rhodospirillales bacterium]